MKPPLTKIMKITSCIMAFLFLAGCATNRNLLQQSLLIEQIQDAVELASVATFKELPASEKLTYTVKWLGMPVGTLTSSVKGMAKINGREAFVLEAIFKTNGFCSRIFPVNDRYISYVDKEQLYTLQHEVYRREGKYKKDAITVFDHVKGKAYFRNLLDKSKKVFDIPAGVHDFLSANYFFRSLPLKVGDKVRYTVSTNEKNYQVVVLVKSRAAVKLGALGEKKALLIQPYVILEGKQLKQGSARGYYSPEGNHPLLGAIISAPVFTKITAFLSMADSS
jgi:hypothetical protein